MKVLVTGYHGQLGHDVIKYLNEQEVPCIGTDLEEFDITDKEQTTSFIKAYGPDVVVHCAAYTAVDRAEEEKETCRAVNVEGTRNIAAVCGELGCKMVYISTDYVFPGTGDRYYEVDSTTGPLSQYGRTKLQGEQVVEELLKEYFIVRISWVFGKNGNNFVKTMLRLAKEKDEIAVIEDQIGSPTYTYDLARLIYEMIQTENYGVYHATNEGICSWAEFAEEIFRVAGKQVSVRRILASQYSAKAVRPSNSRLSKKSLDQAGFPRLPEWKDALQRYIMELNEAKS